MGIVNSVANYWTWDGQPVPSHALSSLPFLPPFYYSSKCFLLIPQHSYVNSAVLLIIIVIKASCSMLLR